MTEEQQAKFEGWAIVEVMGHQRYVGFVTTEAYGQAVLFRIDVPELPERERDLKRPEWNNGRNLPAGAHVKEVAVPGYSKLIGAGSIYAITPCTQEVAVEEMQPRKLMLLALPKVKAIAAAAEPQEGYYDDGDDDDIPL